MFISADEKDERRLFTYEERSVTLKRSRSRCSCCGKKLTTKTMTMDHIIPLSRGGKNEAENLIALCPECNKRKGNMLYLPYGYYNAMDGSSEGELVKMEKYVEAWFQEIKDQFDIQRFPLIAPVTNVQVIPFHTKAVKKVTYNSQLIYRWSLIGNDHYDEIEAVTGLDLQNVRKTISKYRRADRYYTEARQLPVALYSFRKLTNDKIIAVMAVRVEPEFHHMTIYFPWCISTKKYAPEIIRSFVEILIRTIDNIAKLDILSYTIISKIPQVVDFIRMEGLINDPKVVYTDGGKFLDKKTDQWHLDILTLYRCELPQAVKAGGFC